MLHVAPALLHTRQIQRGTAEQRYSLSFTFPQVARCVLAIALLALTGMPKQDMGQFMKAGLIGQGIDGIDRDAASPGKPQAVPIGGIKRNLLHIEGLESLILVPGGNGLLGPVTGRSLARCFWQCDQPWSLPKYARIGVR